MRNKELLLLQFFIAFLMDQTHYYAVCRHHNYSFICKHPYHLYLSITDVFPRDNVHLISICHCSLKLDFDNSSHPILCYLSFHQQVQRWCTE